jgi:hypothetical protein
MYQSVMKEHCSSTIPQPVIDAMVVVIADNYAYLLQIKEYYFVPGTIIY